MNVDAEVCNYTPQRCCVTLNINIQAFRRTITHLSIDILTSTLRRTTILRGTTTLRWVKRVKADNESAMPHTRSGQVTQRQATSVDLLKGIPCDLICLTQEVVKSHQQMSHLLIC